MRLKEYREMGFLLLIVAELGFGACSSKAGGRQDARDGLPPGGGDTGAGGAEPGIADAGLGGASAGPSDAACGEIDGPTANNPGGPDFCTDDSPCPAGLLCGGINCDMPWTCFSHGPPAHHPCPPTTAAYCGCDGVTFYPFDTCPDRPYEHVGPCEDGVNCNPDDLRCSQVEPQCPDGMFPSVVKGSYGPCVPSSACRCEFLWQCPHRDLYSCDTSVRRCVLTSSRDAGQDGPSDGGVDVRPSRVSGVDQTKRLDQLTLDEKKTLCDFKASFFGGYGMDMQCGIGLIVLADTDQDSCVAAWPTTCAVLVAQLEQCDNDRNCAQAYPLSCEPLLACK